ncbi:MAG: extracellular solute-binding protein [bacterium]|nr:extracellular solute-binding protein [bacterium]
MSAWKLLFFSLGAGVLLYSLYPARSTHLPSGVQEIVMWAPGNELLDMEPVLKRFERENPGYRVIIGQAAARDMVADPQRFLCGVAGGMPPDVIKFDRYAISEWASRGAFASLNEFLEADARATNLPYRVSTNTIIRPALEEATYQGKLYGIPESADVRILYYNRDILVREGFVDEHGNARPPRTWEELEDYAVRLTRRDRQGRITRLGFAPNVGNSWLYLYAWQNGGEFMSPDGRTCTMNSPAVAEALAYMTRVYDRLGGAREVYAFQSTFQANELDPFLTGKLVMKIDGDWFLQTIATYTPHLNFGSAPAPMPAARLAAGHPPITWLGGWCLAIPATARNKEGAWKMIRWLCSLEAAKIKLAEAAENSASQGRVFLPRMGCDTALNQFMFQEYVLRNPNISTDVKNAFRLCLEMLPEARYRPVTPVGQLLWNQHIAAFENAVYHKHPTPQAALDEATRVVQKELDRYHTPPRGPIVSWPLLVAIYLAIAVCLLVGIALWQATAMRDRGYFRRRWLAGLVCAAPWLIGFLLFTGGPILFSIIMSFCHYDILNPAVWVGLRNYRWILRHDPLFWKALWNTLYMVIGIPLGLVVSLSIAMLLNQQLKGMTFYRTLFYMPAIVPAVAASILWLWIFNPTHGLLNTVLSWFGITGPAWLQDETWSKPSLILMGLWGAGSGMIIWLAGLKGIPTHLYEAAEVDGANAWQRFFHITLPMLSPYIFFNIVMGLIGTFQTFSQAYIMTQGGPVNSTLFYAYHLFNTAFRYLQMGEASAMAWVLFAIVFVLTLIQLWLSKRWVHYEAE